MMSWQKRDTGLSVECPFCGVQISAYISEPIRRKAELHHDPPMCKDFEDRREDEAFLDELRNKLIS